jgi:hypothetical protein
VELAAADIDRVDALRSAFEQNLHKAAGGRTDVEADMPFRIEAEVRERGCELEPAP